MKSIQYTILPLWVFLSLANPASGQGWVRTYPRLLQPAALHQTPDQGSVFIASLQLTGPVQQDIALVKTGQDGRQQWLRRFGGTANDIGHALDLTPGGWIVAAGEKGLSSASSNAWFAKIAMDGSTIWEKEYNLGVKDAAKGIRALPDGGFIAIADTEEGLRLLRLDTHGDTLWTKGFPQTFGMKAKSVEVLPNGGYLIALVQNNLPLVAPIAGVLKTGPDGQFVFFNTFQHLSGYASTDLAKAVRAADTLYLLAHRDSIYQLDSSGQLRQALRLQAPLDLYTTDILPATDGGFWALGTAYTLATPPQSRLYFGRFTRTGVPIWLRQIPGPSYLHATWAMARADDGGFLLSGNYRQDNRYFSYIVRTDSSGMTFTNTASGRVYWNKHTNCGDSTDIKPLSGWMVKITHPNGETHYASTDDQGYFSTPVGLGVHQLSLLLPGNWWGKDCAPDVALNFDTTFSEQSAVFPVQTALVCPLPWVDIGTNHLQPCVETALAVRYANRGTATAPNASLTLRLDPALALLGAEKPFTPLGNNRFHFTLGDLSPLQQEAFNIQVKPDCGAPLGSALCAEAVIQPDTPCTAANNVPLIVVSGRCEGDSVRFRLQNLGGDMNGPQEFIIIEDNIVLFQGQYELRTGQQHQHAVPINGSTWRLEAEQAPGVSPLLSDPYIAAVVEGCSASGAFSTGFLNQYSLFDGGFFREIDCHELSMFRPANEKIGYPLGFGAPHYIPANTDLEYTLHVQNTGPDTVRAVVLLDTLDAMRLDVSTIQPGASSQPYRWRLEGQGVLRFAFDSLLLPPASVDSLQSRVWVKFRVGQWPNLPVGTVIHNGAAVYLGFNAPAQSNETWHTIGAPLYQEPPLRPVPESALWVYPTPASGSVMLQLKRSGAYEVVVYDVGGRLIVEKAFAGTHLLMPDAWLPPGVFVVVVRTGGQLVGATKIIKLKE